jgi:hypothetical protein
MARITQKDLDALERIVNERCASGAEDWRDARGLPHTAAGLFEADDDLTRAEKVVTILQSRRIRKK